MFFDLSVSLHHSVSTALIRRCVPLELPFSRPARNCRDKNRCPKGVGLQQTWNCGEVWARRHVVCGRCRISSQYSWANTSGCGEESFGRSDKRRICSKEKVGGQLGGWLRSRARESLAQTSTTASEPLVDLLVDTQAVGFCGLYARLEGEMGRHIISMPERSPVGRLEVPQPSQLNFTPK
jgi:hypothetical protein